MLLRDIALFASVYFLPVFPLVSFLSVRLPTDRISGDEVYKRTPDVV